MSAEQEFDALKSQFAKQVRRFRSLRGLTQEAAADRAGLATRHLQKIEAGCVNVTLHTVARLSVALEVAPNQFFTADPGAVWLAADPQGNG